MTGDCDGKMIAGKKILIRLCGDRAANYRNRKLRPSPEGGIFGAVIFPSRPMRPTFAIIIFLAACASAIAAPVNDNFAARLSLAGSSASATGTNEAATVEAGEDTRLGLFGATVWWSWVAPASGWARVDTGGSTFDTVLQISTGATVGTQTPQGFNDQSPDFSMVDASSVTFMVTAGTVYNIAVGGWDSFGADEGDIALHITSGTAAKPAFFPATLMLTPPSADITSAAVTPFPLTSAISETILNDDQRRTRSVE